MRAAGTQIQGLISDAAQIYGRLSAMMLYILMCIIVPEYHLFWLPRRFWFILIELMFQDILVLVKGASLLRFLKNLFGISSYILFSSSCTWDSNLSITEMIFFEF